MATADYDEAASDAADLTKFQLRILAILADEARYGLAIKRELEDYYGEEVNHGRLYPNLDELADQDLVEKSELDKRTNEYALTDAGADAIADELAWVFERVDVDVHLDDEVQALIEAEADNQLDRAERKAHSRELRGDRGV